MNRIIILGDRFAIINCYGDILVTGITIQAVIAAYCKEYDCTTREMWKLTEKDYSRVFYDEEHDKYLTSDMLLDEFNSDSDLIDRYNWKFGDYIADISGKNGTLEEIARDWNALLSAKKEA